MIDYLLHCCLSYSRTYVCCDQRLFTMKQLSPLATHNHEMYDGSDYPVMNASLE